MGKNKQWFQVVKQSLGGPEVSEVAVLGNDGEYLLAVPYTRKTYEHKAQFERKAVILKMSQAENKPLTLTMEKVGPLQPVE